MSDPATSFLVRDFAVIMAAAAVGMAACRAIGLSPIVGYLLAGMALGAPKFGLIELADPERAKALSQLGLVFLMFSIGLGFRLQRFKQLGGIALACAAAALMVVTLGRMTAGWLGFAPAQALFFAAMLAVSSSATISKILQSQGLLHRRYGQLALGVTLCEDVVAIVLLALLGSYAAVGVQGEAGWSGVLAQVGTLLAFAALLIAPGLVFVPRLLRRISRMETDSREFETIVVSAMLFGTALLTLSFGYSLAFGSFLCGVIAAESSRGKALDEAFSGMRDFFVAVFFVSIGLAVDLSRFPEALGLIALGTGLALVLRPLAAQASLLLVCESPRDAARAGLLVTPIGEFSFVIANLGVATGLLETRFQVAAVGVALITATLAPLLARSGDPLAAALSFERFRAARVGLDAYRRLWRQIFQGQNGRQVWRLLLPRIPQVAAELLFVSAILVFSRSVYQALLPRIEAAEPALQEVFRVGYWAAVAVLALVPALALARNINALAMLVGESLASGLKAPPALRRALALLVRSLGLLCLGLWILNIMPFAWLGGYALAAVTAAVVLALAFGWRAMVRLHSQAALALSEALGKGDPAAGEERALRQAQEEWGVELEDWTLGQIGQAGLSIGELQLRKRSGATVVGIERQGYYLPSIGPETHLFPGDRLYATGGPEQLAALRRLLSEEEKEEEAAPDFRSAILQTGRVEPGSPCEGKTLRDLQWPRLLGAQVVAIKRDGEPPRAPESEQALRSGDALLLVGSRHAVNAALARLAGPGRTSAGGGEAPSSAAVDE